MSLPPYKFGRASRNALSRRSRTMEEGGSRSARPRSKFILGVDIGTTSVKACLVDTVSGKSIQSLSQETNAHVASDVGHFGNEQELQKIITAFQFCVSRLPKDSLRRVVRVGVSGQMHGVVLWKQSDGWHRNQFGRYAAGGAVSSLYTWQDGRCSPQFLSALPASKSHLRLSTGHGCSTLFWLRDNRPGYLDNFDRAGTVQDYVVAMLCALPRPIMSVQNAASWGYFDTVTSTWDITSLETKDFPVHLLPDVVAAGEVAGQLTTPWYGIPEGTPVGAALGDMQCSVFTALERDSDAVFNISTSAQLSFVMPPGFVPHSVDASVSVEYFPYFGGRYLAVAASLNGGNVLAAFVRTLQQWTHELGLGVPEDKIWQRIVSLAQEVTETEPGTGPQVTIVPTLFGERHLPDQRASVHNIDPLNISLGEVSKALCVGIVHNIHCMMSSETLHNAGIERIVGSGAALTRNPVLKREVEHQFGLPVIYGAGCDAALGVARAMSLNTTTPNC